MENALMWAIVLFIGGVLVLGLGVMLLATIDFLQNGDNDD